MFKPVVEASAHFEKKLWDIIANCVDYGQVNSTIIINIKINTK